jgi:hypothetical protein
MPFIETPGEGLSLESIRTLESLEGIGRGRPRRRLLAVSILADMERRGRTMAVVTRAYTYFHELNKQMVAIDVPEGFVTDFASVPKLLHFLIPPFGRHAPAAVLHDYVYAIGEKKARKLADKLFLYAMQESGVDYLRRSVMYRMVRTFGWKGYGLASDWAFVDPEYGDEIVPPFAREERYWAPERPKKGRKGKKNDMAEEGGPATA